MFYYALCLPYYSNTEAALFACLSSGWATTTSRLLGPKVKNSIKCLSQGHSDALPHRELIKSAHSQEITVKTGSRPPQTPLPPIEEGLIPFGGLHLR